MRIIIFFIWLFTALSIAQEKPEMQVYVKNNNMEKGYRTLTTIFTDSLVFKKKFKDSKYSLDYVLRYYYATAIDLGCDKNELISMSGLVFPIESAKPDEIVEEVIALIGNMYYGRKEDMDFKKKLKKN
ncbi:MAG: hypothetical protein CMD37_00760 [Flavobacteriales bacterium]|nr:hypothetical protein [Flavobacteriales bacterium]